MKIMKDQQRREKLICRSIVICCIFVGITCILGCGYGHAALSRDLMISGKATISYTTPTFGIKCMQEMTTDICTHAEIGTTQQLTDIRDGKKYWVEKMANGGCWMLQNLDYVSEPLNLILAEERM